MRTYGKVHTSFWTDPKTVNLSGDAQRLALYLLTGPHSNSIGCYRLPLGYLMEDFRSEGNPLDAATLERLLDELVAVGFIVRDKVTGWTLVANFLRHNAPENGKVAKSMVQLIDPVPRHTPVWTGLVKALMPHRERFPNGYIDTLSAGLEGVSEPSPDTLPGTVLETVCDTVCHTVSHTLEHKSGTPEPEPEPEPKPKPKPSEAKASGAAAPPVPLEKQVFDLGKSLLGKSSGGMIVKLRRRYGNDDRRVLGLLETAATKHNPAEYIGRLVAGEREETEDEEIAEIRRRRADMGVFD